MIKSVMMLCFPGCVRPTDFFLFEILFHCFFFFFSQFYSYTHMAPFALNFLMTFIHLFSNILWDKHLLQWELKKTNQPMSRDKVACFSTSFIYHPYCLFQNGYYAEKWCHHFFVKGEGSTILMIDSVDDHPFSTSCST